MISLKFPWCSGIEFNDIRALASAFGVQENGYIAIPLTVNVQIEQILTK